MPPACCRPSGAWRRRPANRKSICSDRQKAVSWLRSARQREREVSVTGEKKKLLPIGEVAHLLGITTRTIRYYEEFGIMAPPQRLDGGHRVYAREDITRLKFILKLKELGLTLREMQELADLYRIHQDTDRIMPRLLQILDGHLRHIDGKISTLGSLRQEIAGYRRRIAEILQQDDQAPTTDKETTHDFR
ncbi:MAG: MerR family transcriptional regulator [Desulfuromonadales bacterium]|nr:MerR family transcriptional regulator [Desulfuromonadales bacterium]